jgi:formylglycine-generating enzyme required for sulfatase activity
MPQAIRPADSRPTRRTVAAVGLLLLAGCRADPTGHPATDLPEVVPMAAIGWEGLSVGRTEVTIAHWHAFLRDTSYAWPGGPDWCREANGNWRPPVGRERYPATHVSRSDAEAYCAWLSTRRGMVARLPTAEEWAAMASAGLHRPRFPWGWEPAEGRAAFALAAARPVASYPANRLGLHDLAGNVWEWCAGEGALGEARGGSWAERDELFLTVSRRQPFPAEYRDADVGFRVIVVSGR